ncbi:MAG TPA: HDOD domain-containing protein [Spongiibacteraceae bacterium]|nr:HDOD domain-containing protein [Spongiibacteraceae bacterium]
MPRDSAAALTARPTHGIDDAATHRLYLQILLAEERPDSANLSVPEKLVRQVVEQQLRNGELRRAAVPRLPTVIPLLLKQLRDPNASARDYVAVIRQDPVVATAVLTLANSAYFNPYRKQVDNFEQAVAALGINGLRLVLSTAVLQPIVRGRGDSLPQKVWNQSFVCAICCQQLAERERLDAFKAYLAGLVHNIGLVTIYNQVQQQSQQHLSDTRPGRNLLLQLIEQWSQPLAYWIAQDWQLPTEIIRALGAQGEKTPTSNIEFAAVLQRASHFAETYMLERAGRVERSALLQLAASEGFPEDILATLDGALTDILLRK